MSVEILRAIRLTTDSYLYWGTEVWNIDIYFVVFKKQIRK